MQILTQKFRFTVAQYHQMARSHIFQPEEKLELIEGEILQMSPVGLKHAKTVKLLNHLLTYQLYNQAIIGVQDPIQLDDFSEPQPDLSILKIQADFYELEIPKSKDIYWLIEVSDSTIKYDRDTKIPLYAANNIPEVWVVNLNDHLLEIYRQPENNHYQKYQKFTPNQTVSPLAFPDLIINLSEILA
jgi:Uma2 family endonuclease